ncbi:MAG TPA: tripartite tricarboxylate transporter TctB family protein [Advenella sp.]|nr:tripartite tricarboxylate transporter TctB family protein [Advenella sp.]
MNTDYLPGVQPGTWLCEKKYTRVFAVVCFVAFSWIAWLSREFPPALNPVDVGPGKVPMLVAGLGIICSVVLFFQAARIASNIEIQRPAAVASGMLVMMGYVLLIPIAGFYAVSLFAVPLLMLVGGERRPVRLILCSAGFVLFIYLCFQLLLGVEFP